MMDYLRMGGYADFVWPAYGAAAVGLIGAFVITWRGLKAREREFETMKRQRRGETS
ncbi:MAG: heme exporter protein CcmD [Rhodospirillaceae bacterium]|nr:MAG: heme exporter protein CcmD [Rhodospirillaceae bacterium]